MGPYTPPQSPTTNLQACVLCGHPVERNFSSVQRVRCDGCGCMLALKLPATWAFSLALAQIAAYFGLVWLPLGIAIKSLLFLAMIVLSFITFSLATSWAGKLWPVSHGVFISNRSLKLARQRYFGQSSPSPTDFTNDD